jgi:linearmycin/streptolysin S transport system permease protein
MNFRKVLTIAWRSLYVTYTDRNLILIMIATPLALATIIGLAFSGFISGGNDVPIHDIPVAIVNLDQTVNANGTQINDGQILVNLLIPPADSTATDTALTDLTNAVQVDEPEAARAAVDAGTYAAAIIIPADFSQKVTYTQTHQTLDPVAIQVYGSSASPTSAEIIRSITERIASQIATGNITLAATINAFIQRAQSDPAFAAQFGLSALGGSFKPDFSPAFDPTANPVSIEQQTVTGQAATFNPLVVFGSAQAIFFTLFTAMGGATSILEEKRDGTLQRLLASPTPRIVILLGKMVGTFANCAVQITLLCISLTIVGSLISGHIQFIWGTNLLAILVVILAAALAASGLGVLVTSLVRSIEQGNVIGSVISMAMGVLGGAVFNVQAIPFLRPLSRLTIVYWGTDAFTKLSNNQTDIMTNILVLLGLGAVMFAAGLVIFNRRLEV